MQVLCHPETLSFVEETGMAKQKVNQVEVDKKAESLELIAAILRKEPAIAPSSDFIETLIAEMEAKLAGETFTRPEVAEPEQEASDRKVLLEELSKRDARITELLEVAEQSRACDRDVLLEELSKRDARITELLGDVELLKKDMGDLLADNRQLREDRTVLVEQIAEQKIVMDERIAEQKSVMAEEMNAQKNLMNEKIAALQRTKRDESAQTELPIVPGGVSAATVSTNSISVPIAAREGNGSASNPQMSASPPMKAWEVSKMATQTKLPSPLASMVVPSYQPAYTWSFGNGQAQTIQKIGFSTTPVEVREPTSPVSPLPQRARGGAAGRTSPRAASQWTPIDRLSAGVQGSMNLSPGRSQYESLKVVAPPPRRVGSPPAGGSKPGSRTYPAGSMSNYDSSSKVLFRGPTTSLQMPLFGSARVTAKPPNSTIYLDISTPPDATTASSQAHLSANVHDSQPVKTHSRNLTVRREGTLP